jgi:two-component system competent response regulator ComA
MAESRVRVLIVDDDPASAELTQRRLESVADVDFNDGPEGALERIENGGYDVILLDLNMPGTSGLQVLDMLKKHGDSSKVVLYSSMDESQLAEISRTAGVDYMTKSATKDEMIDKITAVRDSQVAPESRG